MHDRRGRLWGEQMGLLLLCDPGHRKLILLGGIVSLRGHEVMKWKSLY
jgi:hypothetical protein